MPDETPVTAETATSPFDFDVGSVTESDVLNATVAVVCSLGGEILRADRDMTIGALITSVRDALSDGTVAAVDVDDDAPVPAEPAVSVRKSLANPDFIISMIDGKAYKTLKRHLSGHGMTPESYRAHFGLKEDYPMVAQTYSESRRNLAKSMGLGRKPGSMSEVHTSDTTTDTAEREVADVAAAGSDAAPVSAEPATAE